MKIKRYISTAIAKGLDKGKVIVLFGARQVGKTTLIQNLINELDYKTLSIVGDDHLYSEAFSSNNLKIMQEVVSGYDLLFIDEAQSIPDIGSNIKLLHDARHDLKIILTGSSSFDLANRVREPLTGRTITFQLHPLSVMELLRYQNPFELKQHLHRYLLYGGYPEVVSIEGRVQKIRHLKELTQAYLYKDILQLTSIRHTQILHKLLKLLALRIGSLVSLQKLSNALDLSFDTVRGYLELLEKAFVIHTLSGYSKNPGKEISKMDKIYFADIGIRNAVLNNFNDLQYRMDTGALWENFLFMERTKYIHYKNDYAEQFFWRKYSGAEIDYIESKDGGLSGYEFKWGKSTRRSSKSWKTDYPDATHAVVDRDNFLEFIS